MGIRFRTLLALVLPLALADPRETHTELRRPDRFSADVRIVQPLLQRRNDRVKETHQMLLRAAAGSPEQLILPELRKEADALRGPRAILLKDGRANEADLLSKNDFKEAVLYHDCKSEAVITATSVRSETGAVGHCLDGIFVFNGFRHYIRPSQARQCASGVVISLDHLLSREAVAEIPVNLTTCRFHDDPTPADATRTPVRRRRQAWPVRRYSIDMSYVVDYSVYSWFLTQFSDPGAHANKSAIKQEVIARIRYYFTNVAAGVALRYSGLKNTVGAFPIRLTVNLVNIYTHQDALDSVVTEGSRTTVQGLGEPAVDGDQALQKLSQYVNTSNDNYLSTISDHVALFTRYRIYRRSTNWTQGVLGLTEMDGLCSYRKVALIRFVGAFFESFLHGHELGHNMGVRHDGDGNYCSPQDQFLMAPILETASSRNYMNNFLLSDCSFKYIYDRLRNGERTGSPCFLDNEYFEPNADKELPGQKYSAEEQCKMLHGSMNSTWSTCGGASNMQKICWSLPCFDGRPNSTDCQPGFAGARAAEGTSCGNRKWCIKGSCVFDTSAPKGSDDCPGGDFKGLLTGTDYTCKDLPPHMCYYSDIRDSCCDTCLSYATDSMVGCEYGDRDPSFCKSTPVQECKNGTVLNACCSYCQLQDQDSCPQGGCNGSAPTTAATSTYSRTHSLMPASQGLKDSPNTFLLFILAVMKWLPSATSWYKQE